MISRQAMHYRRKAGWTEDQMTREAMPGVRPGGRPRRPTSREPRVEPGDLALAAIEGLAVGAVLARRLDGRVMDWSAFAALGALHDVDPDDVIFRAREIDPTTSTSPRPSRAGRPGGSRGHCSVCHRAGHTRATCAERKR